MEQLVTCDVSHSAMGPYVASVPSLSLYQSLTYGFNDGPGIGVYDDSAYLSRERKISRRVTSDVWCLIGGELVAMEIAMIIFEEKRRVLVREKRKR